MSLKQEILENIKTAMKARDTKTLEVLRYVNAQIKNKEIEVRPKEVTDEDVMQVLKKYLKQRKEAMEQFQSAGREDLVAGEKEQAAIVEKYLPEMMSEEQLKPVVEEAVKALGASSMKDMGAVMKEVMAKTAGKADGKMISTLVKASLG